MASYNFVKKISIKPFLYGLVIFLIFACSNEKENKKTSINIKSITASQAINRAPKESDFQVDIALTGAMGAENANQDIQYEWFVQYLKMDIQNDSSLNKQSSSTQISPGADKNYLKGFYFLDISKDPLNSMLSIYAPGYYKVTLQASNADENREYSVIIKTGDVAYPTLFVKVNIPDAGLNSDDSNFKGNFYINIANENMVNNNNVEIKAKDIKNGWYDTKIQVNPFASFSITAGTHVLKDSQAIASVNDNFEYYFDPNKMNTISSTPLILKNVENTSPIFISKSDKEWQSGEIYASFLLWNTDENNKDSFNYFERTLDNNTGTISVNLNNAYIAKIFIGSFGIKSLAGKYFVYFGPEGTDVEELDPKNQRDFNGLPYGCLLGKLNSDGNPFQIGSTYNYKYNSTLAVLKQDPTGNFVKE